MFNMYKQNINLRNMLLILTLTILVSCQTTSKSTEPIKADKTLSPTDDAIKNYKETFQWEKGFESWSKIPKTENYHMVAPNLDLKATGAKEIEEVVFEFVKETELKQKLVDIIEHGNYITYLLKITRKTSEVMDLVEVFLVDDECRVKKICAL